MPSSPPASGSSPPGSNPGSETHSPPSSGASQASRERSDFERLIAENAPSLARLAKADPELMRDVTARPIHQPLLSTDLETWLGTLTLEDTPAIRQAIRKMRHRALVRIVLREVSQVADVAETAHEMSVLACFAVETALQAATATELKRAGIKKDSAPAPLPLVVLGMGKLGGMELNLGSDIDLCFFYEQDDAQWAGENVGIHELFSRIARRTALILSEVTEHGFVFRVDLRLRPEGSQGALVNSLQSAERYYASFGRTWERAALLRSRPIAGDLDLGKRLLDILSPFVFPRAVDPSIADQMAEMLIRSRSELKVDESHDVKLGYGGIREAEFFVQTLQLIWGGQHPELRVPATLDALRRLERSGLVSPLEASQLSDGWSFLRRIEHRIHAWTGYQTHAVPQNAERDQFAHSLGFENASALHRALTQTRIQIASLFASLHPNFDLSEHAQRWDPLIAAVASGESAPALAAQLTSLLPTEEPLRTATHLRRLGRHAKAPLGAVTVGQYPELGRRLLTEISEAADPDAALRFASDFFTRLRSSDAYRRLFVEEPRLARRLVGLFGASPTLSKLLVGHPEDVDLLLYDLVAPSSAQIAAAHAQILTSDLSDTELLIANLRRVKRSFTLHLGLSWMSRDIPLEVLCERLSEIADAQIQVAFEASKQWGFARYGKASQKATMVVCAVGKLGGRELGIGSDLDLFFLYDRPGETETSGTDKAALTHAELFAKIAQRTMLLLRQPSVEGDGFATDTRLRPSGAQGTLVVPLKTFREYHAEKSAMWERQALTRARVVAGETNLGSEVEDAFQAIAYGSTVDLSSVNRVRLRIEKELAQESTRRFHPKLGYGGLVDVEFLVQTMQMTHGAHVRIRTTNTRAAIIALEEAGFLSSSAARTLEAGRAFLRAVEQSLKLYDHHREPFVEPSRSSGARVARTLGFRNRDGKTSQEVLRETYQQHTRAIRALLEAQIGPITSKPPWSES